MKHRVETIGQATLILGDAREVMPEIADYDAVITSPPYGGIRDYGGHGAPDWRAIIDSIAANIRRGGVCMWNVADQTINGSETGDYFDMACRRLDAESRQPLLGEMFGV
mgnify:FL=1